MDAPDNVVSLGYPAVLRHGFASAERLESGRLGVGYRNLAFAPGDGADAEAHSWLDTNAPGWSLRVVLGERSTIDRQGVLAEIVFYAATLVFLVEEHRTAWQFRKRELDAIQDAVRARAAQLDADPNALRPCLHCGDPMTPYTRRQVVRTAQFGFAYTARGHECLGCGVLYLPPVDADAIALRQAKVEAASRTGLPRPWPGAAMHKEWTRREAADPQYVVECQPGMDAAAILSALDRMLERGAAGTASPWLRLVETDHE